jgi:outer membrane protein assembly factor BamD (BamD/ComL family)
MSRLTKFHRLLTGAACVVALSACSTAPVKPTTVKMPLDQAMSKATAASKAGQKEQALKMLEQASTDYPTDKTPWVQKAQIRYEGGQYGEAILDAQQVLARDPTDKVANSIVAISGLRLSTAAIADLVRQNNLTGTTRSESQELAKLLRESVGEKELFTPPPAPKPRAVPPATRSKARAGAAPAAPAKDAGDSASPFDALK